MSVACLERGQSGPLPESIEPASGRRDVETGVTVSGRFEPVVRISYASKKRSQVDTSFELRLGNAILADGRYVDSGTLTAMVPAGLAPGSYDLTVTNAKGESGRLPDAFLVVSDNGGGDGVSSDGAPGDPAPGDSSPGDPAAGDPESTVVTNHQSGTAAIGDTVVDRVVPLSPPVDPQAAVLFFNTTNTGVQPRDGQVSGQLASDGASVTFSRDTAAAVDVQIEWSVVELTDVRVLRAGSLLSSTQAVDLVTLTRAVDTTRSFVLTSLRTPGISYNDDDWLTARLVDSTTLELARGAGFGPTIVEWQLVELLDPAAAVQHGDVQMAVGQTSAQVTLPTAAPLAWSFLICTHRVMARASPRPPVASHVLRGRLISATEIAFDRDGSDLPIEIAWSVVTLASASAQHGNASFAIGESERRVTLTTPIDPTRTVSFLPSQMREGKTPHTTNDSVGVAWFTTRIADGGATLVIARGVTVDAADAAWTVLELR
ncbi:MAG: hypothetical protein V3T05_10020 [Myxococcota bacterium]